MVLPFGTVWTELIVAICDRISQTNAAGNDELLDLFSFSGPHTAFLDWKQYKHTDLTDLSCKALARTYTHFTLTHTRGNLLGYYLSAP